MIQKYLDDLLEIGTVKEGNEYVLGYYHNRVPVYGLYLKAKKGSILERVEFMAKGKFKLESDAENYAQASRVVFFEILEQYIKDNGEPKTENEIDNMNAWLYKSCLFQMSNISRVMKSGATFCDRATGEYSIVQLLSLDASDDFSNTLQGEVEDVMQNNLKKSFSYFRAWFNDNRDKILTKKQLQYLEDEQSILQNHRARMNKTISERIYRSYTDESIHKYRIEKISHRIEIIDKIIKSRTDRHLMLELMNAMKHEDWLLEGVYSLSFDTCSMITDACKNNEYECKSECVKEIKTKLYELGSYFSTILERLEKSL